MLEKLREIVQPGDVVMTLGAGSIYQIGESLLESLRQESLTQRREGAKN